MKQLLKQIKKKVLKREFLTKLLIVVSSVALLATTVLPYVLR